jgi:hypothetical protein
VKAGVNYRWHDLRHTFVSRLAENPHVSEETIRSLAGHVSKLMMQRYSHIRTRAKEDAIAALEQNAEALPVPGSGYDRISSDNGAESEEIGRDRAQNWAQSRPERLN